MISETEKLDVDPSIIAQATGLSEEQVKAL